MPTTRRMTARFAFAAIVLAGALTVPQASGAATLPDPVWGSPAVVASPGASIAGVNVVQTPQGRVVAAWGTQSGGAADGLYASFRDPGSPGWSPAQQLWDGTDGSIGYPRALPNGDVIMPTGTSVSTLPADGSMFSTEPVDTTTTGGQFRKASIASTGRGDTLLAWLGYNGQTDRAYVSRRPAGENRFGAPEAVSPDSEWASGPVVFSPDGEAQALVWQTGPFDGAHLRFSVRPDATAAWSTPQTISGDADWFNDIQVVARPNGELVAGWTQVSDADNDWRTTGDSVQAAVRATGTADGSSWNAPEIAVAQSAGVSMNRTVNGDVIMAVIDSDSGYTAKASVLRAGSSVWSSWFAPVAAPELSGTTGVASRPNGEATAVVLHGSMPEGSVSFATFDPAANAWDFTSPFPGDLAYAIGGAAIAADGEGNMAAAWVRMNGDVIVAIADGAGPRLRSLSVPSTAVAGETVPVSVDPLDAWSPVSSTTWSFGDGAAATGSTAAHVFTTPGTYTVTVTAADSHGHASSDRRQLEVLPPPPSETPSAPTPAVTKEPIIEARLAGRAVTLNAKVVLKRGKRCKGKVTATTAFGGRRYKTRLKLATAGGVCRATGTIRLKKSPSLRAKLRVTLSGSAIKARTLTTRRG